MLAVQGWRGGIALGLLGLLVACGGGGGGGGGAFLPVGGGVSTVTLSGTATYVSIPNVNGGLNYAAAAPKPIRGASVEVVDGTGGVIAATTTDASGVYSASVPGSTSVLLRIKAQMTQGGSGPSWDVTVRDNTQSGAIYALETPAFSSGTAATLRRNVEAPSGWDGSRYADTRVAGPFAILDTVYVAQAKVLSVAPGAVFPPLRLYWSVNNVGSVGDAALGQIGTTSFASDANGRAIYVLGKADVDTDEYDESVIAHEWGHYYQSVFSRDDSPGGRHDGNDLLDRRVAFSEGWGNAWSGIALGRSNYTDSTYLGQASGTNIALSSGGAPTPGWYREASVHAVIWRLAGQVGFKPIHDALTGAAFRNGVAVTSIHSFAAAFQAAAPANAPVLNGLLAGESISAASADPFGLAESNDGGVPSALPLYRSATVGGSTTACVTNTAGPGNKLGDYVYLRFTAPAGARTFTITGPGAADPDFAIYTSSGQVAQSIKYGSSETATVSLPGGEAVLVINDYNSSSASTCFNVTIQ
ncbi:hypothetical protein QTH87_00015 [Variovorax sp. J22P168]|uniref:hypothetical protein n=1 Tax=Variovorax jilinensis TaxID=3053513 RepID=UPI002575E433|nr:hypothetical protein [Variovorax sp. J22P168]MDM0010808.1 hypothetical protein [Variovorax sp. J22P168]